MNYIWENRAGVSWTLSINMWNPTALKVGEECPYYSHGYKEAKIVMGNNGNNGQGGIMGPGGELYTKIGA